MSYICLGVYVRFVFILLHPYITRDPVLLPVSRCTPQKGTGLRHSSLCAWLGWTWRRPFYILSLVGVDLHAPSEIVLWPKQVLGAGPSCQPVRVSHPSFHIEVKLGQKSTPKVSSIDHVCFLLAKSSTLSWTCYLPYQIDFGPLQDFVSFPF